MSERGSFVTEYIWCSGCLEKLKKVLLGNDKYLKGVLVDAWQSDGGYLPIIAGKIGGTYKGVEFDTFVVELFDSDNAPCHPVRVAVLSDTAGSAIFSIQPNGSVKVLASHDEDGHEYRRA